VSGMHKPILTRCGAVLIAVGCLDIAFMVWCIVHHQSYFSSLNIFAVVAGVAIVRGSLRTARTVEFFVTFMLVAFCAGSLLLPVMYPLDYWGAVIRHQLGGIQLVASIGAFAAVLVLLGWVRREVSRPVVRQAQLAAGMALPSTALAIGIGVGLPIFMLVVVALMSRSDTGREAVRRAEQQLGGTYRYVITSMSTSSGAKGRDVRASVAAYNDLEVRDVEVQWSE
jgi:hypothetical protein